MDRRNTRRGSLISALSSIENLHKFVPGSLSRAFSNQSRDHSDVSDNEESWAEVRTSDIPVEEFAKDENWKSVHRAIVSIFHQNVSTVFERTAICKNMSELRRSDIAPYVFGFYQNHLLKRGTKILLNKIETTTKASLQEELLKVWNALYTEMLPLLQTLFQSLSKKITSTSVQRVTLCAFRDDVLLKLRTDDVIIASDNGEFPPSLVQMLLVLQHYSDPDHPSHEGKALEDLVAMTVRPFLGCYGYYTEKDTVVHSKVQRSIPEKRQNIPTSDSPLQSPTKQDYFRSSGLFVPAIERLRQEHSPVGPNMLSTSSVYGENLLQEPRANRRHSVQFDLR